MELEKEKASSSERDNSSERGSPGPLDMEHKPKNDWTRTFSLRLRLRQFSWTLMPVSTFASLQS